MEIKIGIKHVSREIQLESKSTADEVLKALSDARDNNGLFTLTDDRGRTIAVPAEQVGYLDLGIEQSRQVGFGSV
ncbi:MULTISPECIES: DUF3107 domain-containing protein [Aestuariimicrobium]|uniref:DUF3107 domain-containing protein n=1 Tax=Aestuariimicrobium TaxID=396388 RepID=UPI0003B35AAE|nr:MULTISPECIES: DUF3107 domain-containing protein [Aestuariimicrobium]CAI9410753.1 hypothetical protein AESSP_02504 [Aestuariimicrobium sp. T2.26MG-19.2B]